MRCCSPGRRPAARTTGLALAEGFRWKSSAWIRRRVYRGFDIGSAQAFARRCGRACRTTWSTYVIRCRPTARASSSPMPCGRYAGSVARSPAAAGQRHDALLPRPGARYRADFPAPIRRCGANSTRRRLGWPALHAELTALDPGVGRTDPSGNRRTAYPARPGGAAPHRPPFRGPAPRGRAVAARCSDWHAVAGDRAALAQRIAARFDAMLAARVHRRGQTHCTPVATCRRRRRRCDAVGYRQIWEHLSRLVGWTRRWNAPRPRRLNWHVAS